MISTWFCPWISGVRNVFHHIRIFVYVLRLQTQVLILTQVFYQTKLLPHLILQSSAVANHSSLVSAKITWWLCTCVHVCVRGMHGRLHVCVHTWEGRDSMVSCLLSEMEYFWQCEVLGTTTSWHRARWKEGRHRKESSWGGLSQPQAAVPQKSIIMRWRVLDPTVQELWQRKEMEF